jgi:hypothetical protein
VPGLLSGSSVLIQYQFPSGLPVNCRDSRHALRLRTEDEECLKCLIISRMFRRVIERFQMVRDSTGHWCIDCTSKEKVGARHYRSLRS